MRGSLSPYIDGRLPSSERQRIESHIEGCEACRRELESLRAMVNLLHRVPLVSPLRSFALAEVAPQRRPAVFGALRAATAVAVLVLAFLFVGDAFHLFGAGLIEEGFGRQVSPIVENVSDMGGALAEGEEYIWPVLEIELALSGVVVILGGATVVLWHRRRKGGEKALKS